ncbi:hypothetical protein, partial [Herbiconiux daphne]
PNALLGYNQGTGGARQMLSGKKPMAQEGYNYMRNKKFSPEYIAKDASVPVPTQAPASTEIVNLGQEGVQPQTPDKFSQASLMSNTPDQAPQQPQQQPQQQQPQERELSDSEKINLFASKIRGLFDNASVYQNTAANQVRSGVVDHWMVSSPGMRKTAALFGGFQ